MQTLSDALTLAMKQASLSPVYKITFDDATYDQSRILSITRNIQEYSDVAQVLLDNSDGTLTDLDFKGEACTIHRGLVLPDNSTEYALTPTLWVIPQQHSDIQSGSYVQFTAVGIFNLMASDEASEDYEPTDADTNTIKDLITAIAGATLDCFDHCKGYTVNYDSEDSLLDTFCPADFFSIAKGSSRLTAIKKLMGWTNCIIRVEEDGELHVLVPKKDGRTWVANTAYTVNEYVQPTSPNYNFAYKCTTAGTSHATTEPTWPTSAGGTVTDGTAVWTAVAFDYEYELTEEARTAHTIFGKNYRKNLPVPNRIVVQSHPSHASQYSGEATISGYDDLDDDVQKTHFAPYLRLTSDAQAKAIAKAMLGKIELASQRGCATVPMNVGAELYDYVKVIDARQSDFFIGNIGHIKEVCKPENDASKGFVMDFGAGEMVEISPLGIISDEALAGGTASISALLDAHNSLVNFVNTLYSQLNSMIDLLNVVASWNYTAIPFVLNSGTGWKGETLCPFPGEIVACLLGADTVGDIVVDVWKCALGDYPPTDDDSITASATPTLDNEQGMIDTSLTGWTKTCAYLDWIAFNVDSVTDITQCTIVLVIRRT